MLDKAGITRRVENQRFINPVNGRVFTIMRVVTPKVLGNVPDTLHICYQDDNAEDSIRNRGDLIPVQ